MLNSCKQATLSLLYPIGKRCLDCLPAWILRIRPFHVYEIRLSDTKIATPSGADSDHIGDSVRMQWLTDGSQLPLLSELAAMENLRSWNGTTRRVVVAWLDHEPIGAAWIATEFYAEAELGLRYSLHDDEAWLFAAVVRTLHRQRGVYSRLLGFLIHELAKEKRSRVLLGISAGNEASYAAHVKFGARRIGSVFAAKCLGMQFCRGGYENGKLESTG